LDIERQYKNKAIRRGLFKEIQRTLKKHIFLDEKEALEVVIKRKNDRNKIDEKCGVSREVN
jgi:hypothetical protein